MNDHGWVKVYRKTLFDSDMRSLAPGRRWMFVAYILAAEHSGKWRGYLVNDGGKGMSIRQRADICGFTHPGVIQAEQALIELGLLEKNSFGLKVVNYERYQGGNSVTTPTAQHGNSVTKSGNSVTKSGNKSGNSVTVQARTPTPKKEEVQEVLSSNEESIDVCPWCVHPRAEVVGVHFLLQQWHDLYKNAEGFCPTVQPNKDGANIKRLRATGRTDTEIVQAMSRYLADTDAFVLKQGHSLSYFCSKIDAYRKEGSQYAGQRRKIPNF